MSRNAAFKGNFGAGEISPLLHARPDFKRTQTGVRAVNGFLPLPEGGMMRSPGTVFWDFTRADTETGEDLPCRLLAFEFNAADAVLLELYDGVMRVRRYGQLVLDEFDQPYELALPYTAADIARLNWVQSADVIYLAEGTKPIHKLSRLALNIWTIAPLSIDSGPFQPTNTEKDKKITASAAVGTVTLISDFDVFESSHVGTLVRLEPEDWPGVAYWQGGVDVEGSVSGQVRCRNDGRVYELNMAATNQTGFSPPVHDAGQVKMNTYPGTIYTFLSDEDGVVRITAVTNARSATATVIKRIPEPIYAGGGVYATTSTYRWAFGAWSEKSGYPSKLALYDQRMFAARTQAEPRTVWASATGGGYLDFAPGSNPDDAFSLIIDGEGSLNPIQWMAAGARALHIGAQAEEYSLRSISENTAVAVNNARIGRDSSKGSIAAQPVTPEGSPIFISRDGRRLFEINYVIEYDANIARELSAPSRHLGQHRFRQVAHQGAPMSMHWIRRENGDLLALSYNRGEDAQGWARLSVADGFVEDVATTRAGSDDAALLVMVVRRTIDGVTRRCIEAMAPPPKWDFIPVGDVPATHLFCASVFAPETATHTFTVPHLAGETVQVWADDLDFGALTIAGDGTLTLPSAVSRCEVGYFDDTHFLDLLDLGTYAEGGLPGAPRRVQKLPAVQLFASQQGYVQVVARSFGKPDRLGRRETLVPERVASDGLPACTGSVALKFAAGFEEESGLRFTPFSGASLTVAGVTAILEKGAI